MVGSLVFDSVTVGLELEKKNITLKWVSEVVIRTGACRSLSEEERVLPVSESVQNDGLT